MKCLRCQNEMEQYKVVGNLHLRDIETNTKYETRNIVQSEYTPQSAYVCNNCGYIELSKLPVDK